MCSSLPVQTLQMFEPEVNGRPPLHWSRMLHWGVKLQGDYFFGSDPGKRTWHLQIFHWKKRNTPTQTTKERYAPSLKIPEWNVCRCGEAVIFVWHLCSSDDYVYPWSREHPLGCPTSESPLGELGIFIYHFIPGERIAKMIQNELYVDSSRYCFLFKIICWKSFNEQEIYEVP